MITVIRGGAPAVRKPTDRVEVLLARDAWSRDQLETYQRARLRKVLEHAVSASPYYREVLGGAALDPEVNLEDLPTLPKATLMERFDDAVADRRLRLAELEAHATGPDPGALFAREFHVFMTSGTTGRRGVFPQTRAEFAQWLAACWRALSRFGLRPGARAAGIAAPTPLHITQKLFRALGGFGVGRPELAVTSPMPALVEALGRDQPEAILSLVSVVDALATEQLEGRLSIRPRWAAVSSEVVTEDARRRIGEAWGTEPIELYSSTETLVMASEAPERVGLHVSEDLVVLEVVDERDRPVPPGVPGHKVLVTSLVNRALPLIRYEIADAVTLAPGPDPTGRPYQRLSRVDGRSDDILRFPAVGGGEALVLPHRLRAPFARLAEVTQYQIVREPRRLVVRVVLGAGSSVETPDRVSAGVRAALEEAGAIPPAITVEPVSAIEREPGSAKIKLIKSLDAPRPAG
ncbi:MAG TPA: AMP-binding protein [Solirubrobacteraceae bacterium]|nr:AMP-binding protein [Solirubrobacteraceae bacterium]